MRENDCCDQRFKTSTYKQSNWGGDPWNKNFQNRGLQLLVNLFRVLDMGKYEKHAAEQQ